MSLQPSGVSKNITRRRTHEVLRKKQIVLKSMSADQFIKLTTLIDDPKVSIYVGPEAKAYCLSKKLLCHASAYFTAVFEGKFLEGTTQTLTMPEDDPDAFELLIQFLYTDKVVLPEQKNPTISEKVLRYLALLKLADKIGLQDVAEISYSAIRKLLSGRLDEVKRCHLDVVYAEDWPVSEIGTRQRQLFAFILSREFLSVSIDEGSSLDATMRADLAEIPRFAHDVLLWVADRVSYSADKIGGPELRDSFKLTS